jgi:hypothetical protein
VASWAFACRICLDNALREPLTGSSHVFVALPFADADQQTSGLVRLASYPPTH